MKRERPLMIFDGDCHFCSRWIERWKSATGDRVEYRKSQDIDLPSGVSAEDCEQSVQFVDCEGRRHDRAKAVFMALAESRSAGGRLLLWMHERVPGAGVAADAFYDVVAKNRMVFSWLTRTLWGRDVRPPTYAVASAIFLRLLALIYLIAFISYGVQAEGLSGRNGILPVGEIVPQVKNLLGAGAWLQWPSLVLVGDPYAVMTILVWVGVGCAVLVLVDVLTPLALAGAWVTHLSLVVAGEDFYSFQWDALLLEAGLLSIFLAGWSLRPGFRLRQPPRWAHFVLIWLLFRLMFSSGVVKLSSGDPTWENLTALDYHYWTQPIPNPLAWYAAQAPEWWQKFSCIVMFGIELVLPFLIFLPRRPRLVACLGFIALNTGIEFTGNYGYFNLLTVALALLLIDDAVWPRFVCERANMSPKIRWARWFLPPLAVAYLVLSLVPLSMAFRKIPPALVPLAEVYGTLRPFRSINSYGLFAVMTTDRPEILIQGSTDGVTWETYRFKYKPGPLDRRPRFVAPYMPRLDWQMWFAALGSPGQWMEPFILRLFEAQPEVLALLDGDPFDGEKPKYLRAMMDDYHFTTFADGGRDWWKSEPKAIYFREIGREGTK